MSDIVLHTNPMSRGRIARWMLEEVGVDYRVELVEFGAAMHSERFRAVNPMAKVPVLVHHKTVVTETPAICAYLADAFPEAGLAPAQASPARGPYYRWLFFAAGPLEQAVVNASFGFAPPEDDPRAKGRLGYGSLTRVMRTLDGLFADGRDFVLGTAFSAADVYLGAQIIFGLRFGTLQAGPALRAYAGRLTARPAHARAAAADDAAMPGAPGD